METVFAVKWLHILSSTVLFGTGIGTAFQMVWAWRSGRAAVIHEVSRGVVVADWVFTAPAGVVQPLSGFFLIHLQGWSLTEPWLVVTYVLYLLALLCWLPVVQMQYSICNLTRGVADGATPPPQARRCFRIWFALGWPAFLALVGIFWLMVSKPDFGL